jgi:hypothetical protein
VAGATEPTESPRDSQRPNGFHPQVAISGVIKRREIEDQTKTSGSAQRCYRCRRTNCYLSRRSLRHHCEIKVSLGDPQVRCQGRAIWKSAEGLPLAGTATVRSCDTYPAAVARNVYVPGGTPRTL